jgi:pimeloyl-ACP methyl ester carboxylesterase
MKSSLKIILSILLLSLVSQNIFSQEEPINLVTQTGEIKGTLAMPSDKKSMPVVLIISGSGATDRDCNQPTMQTNSFKYLADTLSKRGIASVRFDKRDIGESRDTNRVFNERDFNFDILVNDVKDWIELLAKDARFSTIIVAGHSEGSLIGMLAAKENPNVQAFISISGPGIPADEKIKEQLSSQPQMVKDMCFPILDTLKKGDTIADVSPMIYSLFRPSVQPYMISWFQYDPQEEIKALKIPILIVQGNTDIQVSEDDAELLASANALAEKRIIKDMNHVLKDCDTLDKLKNVKTYNKPELPLNKEFVKEMIAFILKV